MTIQKPIKRKRAGDGTCKVQAAASAAARPLAQSSLASAAAPPRCRWKDSQSWPYVRTVSVHKMTKCCTVSCLRLHCMHACMRWQCRSGDVNWHAWLTSRWIRLYEGSVLSAHRRAAQCTAMYRTPLRCSTSNTHYRNLVLYLIFFRHPTKKIAKCFFQHSTTKHLGTRQRIAECFFQH